MEIWTGTLPGNSTKPSVRIKKKNNLQDKGQHKSKKANIYYN